MTTSDKIRMFSFVAAIMVVFRHSLNYLAFFGSWNGTGACGMVEDTVLRLTEVAVPYFFVVSGFFFFRCSYDAERYVSMLKKKVHTLFVPFVIWNMAGAFCLFFYKPADIGDTLIGCLGNMLNSNWYAPLWYVRDLMTMMVLVPLYQWILLKKWGASLVLALMFCVWQPVDMVWLSSEGVFFFMLGGVLGRYQECMSRRLPLMAMVALAAYWVACSCITPHLNVWLHRMSTLAGLYVCWCLVDYVGARWRGYLLGLSGYSFLIYVMHGYMIKAIKQLLGRMFYGNDMAAVLTFVLLPFVVSGAIVAIGYYWRRYMPKMLAVCTGGR